MDRVIRHYIIKILAVHIAALVVVLAVVAYAGTTLYGSTRQQAAENAIDQARRPAQQAAEGIRRHMLRVYDSLAIAAAEPGQQTNVTPAVWELLQSAASDLLVLDVEGEIVTVEQHFANASGDLEQSPELRAALLVKPGDVVTGPIADAAVEASGTPGRRVLSGPMLLDDLADRPVAMAALCGMDSSDVLIAAVPVDYLDRSFLALTREPGRLGLALVDADGRPLMPDEQTDWPAELAIFFADRLQGRSVAPPLIEEAATVAGEEFDGLLPAIGLIRPPGDTLTVVDIADDEALPADSRRATAGVAAVLNAQSVVGMLDAVSRTSIQWAAILVVAVSAILLSSSAQLIRGRSKLERLRAEVVENELNQARQIQLRWLPGRGGCIGSGMVDVAAENLPASHISGDFYNYFELTDHDEHCGKIALVVGDVTGHGTAAAFLMSTTQLLIENALKRLVDPGRALTEVNAQLSRQAHGGQFVTIIIAVIDLTSSEMQFASAGHSGPLRCGADGRWHDTPVDADLVAGVMEDVTYATTTMPLEDTQGLLFYTDGAVEAANPAGERFDVEQLADGLSDELAGCPTDARAAIDAGLSVVRGFASGVVFDDDLTFLAATLSSRGAGKKSASKATRQASALSPA